MINMSNYTTTVTSVKRADGVEFIMHRTKYSWGTYSNITYLLLNDEDITQLATFNPPLYQLKSGKISLQAIPCLPEIHQHKRVSHELCLLINSTNFIMAGRGSIVSRKA